MHLIIISGPSGSGKSTLSSQILEHVENSFSLSTDNYYKTGILSNFLSKVLEGYYDQKISFNYKLFIKDFAYILNNKTLNHEYKYDFNKKSIIKSLNKKSNISYLIVEGIFAKELLKKSNNYHFLLIELKTTKKTCMERVLLRDVNKRGKSKKLAKRDFLVSWKIYQNNNKSNFSNQNITKLIYSESSTPEEIFKKIINLKT